MKAVYQKTTTGFAPADDAAREFHQTTKLGQQVMMDGKRARNVKHHRKFYKLCQIIVENADRYASVERVVNMFKIAAGWCDEEHRKPRPEELDKARRLRNAAKQLHNRDPELSELLGEVATEYEEGKTVYIPRSIAFESMGQDKFGPFYDYCIGLTCRAFIPNLPESDLRRELEEFVDDTDRQDHRGAA